MQLLKNYNYIYIFFNALVSDDTSSVVGIKSGMSILEKKSFDKVQGDTFKCHSFVKNIFFFFLNSHLRNRNYTIFWNFSLVIFLSDYLC